MELDSCQRFCCSCECKICTDILRAHSAASERYRVRLCGTVNYYKPLVSELFIRLQVLKEVLGAIKDVKSQSSTIELQYIDLLDRFATRVSTCKPALREQYQQQYRQCAQLQEVWNRLEAEAVQINAALEDVKHEFSTITCQQVDKFQERVASFFAEFKSVGPGRGNIDLGVGMKLMRETEASLCEIQQERNELVLAQKLFELDITAYPELSQASSYNN
jgi:dynein heavy chain, axonemal